METRFYPCCCQSSSCGDTEPTCRKCPYRFQKDDFSVWKAEHAAFRPDEIWTPTFYMATK